MAKVVDRLIHRLFSCRRKCRGYHAGNWCNPAGNRQKRQINSDKYSECGEEYQNARILPKFHKFCSAAEI